MAVVGGGVWENRWIIKKIWKTSRTKCKFAAKCWSRFSIQFASIFQNSIAFWKVPRFVFMVRVTYTWRWVWRIGGMIGLLTGENEKKKKRVAVPLCPPETSHELTWDWTRASSVRGRWLAAARPAKHEIRLNYLQKFISYLTENNLSPLQRLSCFEMLFWEMNCSYPGNQKKRTLSGGKKWEYLNGKADGTYSYHCTWKGNATEWGRFLRLYVGVGISWYVKRLKCSRVKAKYSRTPFIWIGLALLVKVFLLQLHCIFLWLKFFPQ